MPPASVNPEPGSNSFVKEKVFAEEGYLRYKSKQKCGNFVLFYTQAKTANQSFLLFYAVDVKDR
jgi:hypothetical protein